MHPRNRNILITVAVIIVVAVAAFLTFGNNKKGNASSKTVNVGIMAPTAQDKEVNEAWVKEAKDKYGINIKFTQFTDYTQPNKALTNGSVDLNQFQHYAFLAAWNKANKSDIVPIGDTIITPIHLYSNKYKELSELPDGASIALPNDPSNESRGLYLLEGKGLIKLKVSGDTLATPSDVTSNPKNLQFKLLDAAQTARALDSVDASIINQNYAASANIPLSKSIAVEPLNVNAHQWINFIAANKKDEDNATYKEVVKAFQSDAVKSAIKKAYSDGSELAAWDLKLK
ncbi:MetQ/NlpA family ABC transporter substrate-binding protein [Lactococcus termiticola]|uniref:Lipoprotein n=1 Tax=Lactococcus termiticola TaxID=2169526 RepID=A0A2R5HI99_9LACT|nr:MetQ/NlpA family ABC transporter substrate-binding protein [Lactococcus termiticola]GBG96010.1 methionine ABC transporter substrate-binding protein [Lactococcus termiticola]